MSRDITVEATFQALVGDETYELWLKDGTDAWQLNDAGDVSVDGHSGTQDFIFIGLTEDDSYVAQIRLKRAGRYRVGYLTANPDTWPSQSRCEFVPGALVDVDAPTIDSATWSRTAADHQQIELSITPFEQDKDLKIFRDGVAIHTVVQPLDATVVYDDIDPPLNANHVYVAKHTAGSLDGPASDEVDCFAGPPAPDLTRTSADDHYGSYTVEWTTEGTAQVQDDFLCTGTFTNVIEGTPTSPLEVHVEETEEPEGGTQDATFHARARVSVTAHGTTDTSDWTDVLVEMLIDDDDPNYNSCP